MIQMGTILQVADNTGAKKIACIKLIGGSTAGQYARVGEFGWGGLCLEGET